MSDLSYQISKVIRDVPVAESTGSRRVSVCRMETPVSPASQSFTALMMVSGPLPLKVRVGNVQGTVLSFRGKAIDLRAMTKDNTVTVTLPAPATTP